MTPEREAELLHTALDVLREVGYASMTMDAVAARARCSKATLYRQWQGKPEMVAAALYATRPVDLSTIDTGSFHGDLMSLVARLSACAEQDTALIAGLSHAALTDKPLVRALREALVEPRPPTSPRSSSERSGAGVGRAARRHGLRAADAARRRGVPAAVRRHFRGCRVPGALRGGALIPALTHS
ncbi:helix-turn-helix domain-containing protein [Streptomyces sp. M19]